jgi:Flp pilus assembly protein TadB
MVLGVVAAMLAAFVVAGGRPPRRHRLAAVTTSPGSSGTRPDQPRSPVRIVAAAVALVIATAALGGVAGIAGGLVAAAVIAAVPARTRPATVRPDDVPVVIDLVAGCLDAGTGLADALDAAAVAGGDVIRGMCREVAASLRAGIQPNEAWRSWLADPWLAPAARTAVRTAQTGAAAAEDFRRTASRLRARRQAAAQHRVRQASVWLVVPLGLCFLPAFVLLAVVPLVVGLLPSLR